MTLTEDQWNDLKKYQEALERYGAPGMFRNNRKERRPSGRKQADSNNDSGNDETDIDHLKPINRDLPGGI